MRDSGASFSWSSRTTIVAPLRTLATPEPIKDWSLSSLKEKLIKIGAKVISHGRSIAFQMAEGPAPRMPLRDRMERDQPPTNAELPDCPENRYHPLQVQGSFGGSRFEGEEYAHG
jgi:hypothetical protein